MALWEEAYCKMRTRQKVRVATAVLAGLLAFAAPAALHWENVVCVLVGIVTGLGGWFMLAPAPGSRETW